MKRYLHIVFLSACALLALVGNAAAQLSEGDIVTITDGNGNYIAVDNTNNSSIVNAKEVSDACYWTLKTIQGATDRDDNEYLYYSERAKMYLYPATGAARFKLDDSGKNEESKEDWYRYLTYEDNKLVFYYGEKNDKKYYAYYDEGDGWKLTTVVNGADEIQVLVKKPTGHTFTLQSPTDISTDASALKNITLKATADIQEEFKFDVYNLDACKKITLTHPNGAISYVTSGITIKKNDARTVVVSSEINVYDVGTYTLKIGDGVIKGKDGKNFSEFTKSWTVEPYTFSEITPDVVAQGSKLNQITISATNNVLMTVADASKIVLKNEGGAVMSTTALITNDNKLQITPSAPLGNGIYTLTIADGAVKGKNDGVPFTGTTKSWTVIVSTSIQHVKGFYSALAAGGYQQVHTVERTIYYTGKETSIPLTLAESNFFGYMRWYNYETDRGNGITWYSKTDKGTTTSYAPKGEGGAFTEVTDGSVHLGWFGWNEGTTGGVLKDDNDGRNTTPEIVPNWNDNKEHTIACDVSSYIDYTITRLSNKIVGITEPRLSYRQIFRFKPASEMAEKVDKCTGDKYLETYYYTAPKSTNIYLATAYHHSMGNAMLNNYFYNATNPTRIPAANLTWYKENTVLTKDYDTQDFQTVSSTQAGEVTYYLRATVDSKTYNIAKFVVNYVDKATYGPVKETTKNGTTKAIISYNEMKSNYEVLEYNNFSFGQTPTSSARQFLTTPLPWNETTYGFAFTDENNIYINKNAQYGVPYYGEYSIVNVIGNKKDDDYWETSANHVDGVTDETTAASQGYAIYVDGTTEPGVVASISTNVTLCGARTMYCSVWLRCPRPKDDGSYKPIFRCNVQGRKSADSPWEDVAVYFAGELGYASKWNQVCFPIVPQDTYSECRVQIYNFGTGGNGNDFLLDDLCIYAEKLPMSSYQLQTEMCCSPTHGGTTFTAAVLRVDYGSTTLTDDSYQYYQIYNQTENKPLKLTAQSLSPYYHEDTSAGTVTSNGKTITTEEYGSIKVREHTFDPTSNQNEEIVRTSPSVFVAELLEDYAADQTKPLWGKCFVAKDPSEITSTSPGAYYMYVVHLVPNVRGNRIAENYLQEQCSYTLRMTNSPSGLIGDNLSCAVEIALPPTQESLFRLNSDQIEATEFLTSTTNNCANEYYTIETLIRRDDDPYSDAGKVEGTYLADWMYGHAFDDVYQLDYPHASDDAENTAKNVADKQFETAYKCTREQVTDAFLDLRRVPTAGDNNPNYIAATFEKIDQTKFSDYNKDSSKPNTSKHYLTLKYLHEQGWLQLRKSSVSFYLESQATARYWVFPIENSGVASDGVTSMHDCPEPRWVSVSTKASQYNVELLPTTARTAASSDPRLSNAIPNVRVLARLVNNTIEIPIHGQSTNDFEVHFNGVDGFVYLTDDSRYESAPQALKYNCSKTDNAIVLTPATDNNATLTIGNEYTLCVRMRDKNDSYISSDGCQVGKIYIKLQIIPDVVKWNPQGASTNWHDDANWQGYGEDVAGYTFTPIEGSNVVIPYDEDGNYPVLTTINPAEQYPTESNFASSPTCGQIYFEPGAMIGNQHLLNHNKAFVDLKVSNWYWNSVAVPIAGVVSGDIYIPHEGDENNGSSTENDPDNLTGGETFNPFELGGYDYSNMSRLSSSAFPFWLSVYNRTVQKVSENPDKTTNFIFTNISTSNVSFETTNSLVVPLEVGHGYQLLGWGPYAGYGNDYLKIRLPKNESEYSYYRKDGALGSRVQINRGENAGKLVYSPTTPLVLRNEVASTYFMLGNPTMAMIDLKELITAIGAGEFYYMTNDAWKAATTSALPAEDRYLMPMQSILIKMPSANTSLSVNIKSEWIKTKKDGNSGSGIKAKRQSASEGTEIMAIYAEVYGTQARCLLASSKAAKNQYISGEDALFISSGVEADVNSSTATSPVNMYTVSEQVPMMVDVRETIDTIPLAMLISEYYQTEKMTMSFELSSGWEKECYFCDIKTGERTLITDGLVLEIDMPANHEPRYYIDGPDKASKGDIVTSTDNLNVGDAAYKIWAYAQDNSTLVVASNDIIKSVTVYDLTGKAVATKVLGLQYNSTAVNVPAGVYVVEATMRDNSKQFTQTVVW